MYIFNVCVFMTANCNMHSPRVITIRQIQTCCPGHVFNPLPQ